MSLETREIKLFGRDIPGFCWDIPAAPEKFEKNEFVFNFWPLFMNFIKLLVLNSHEDESLRINLVDVSEAYIEDLQ